MKKKFRKITAVLLVVVMIALTIPYSLIYANAMTQSDFNSRVATQQSIYPNGSVCSSTQFGQSCFGWAYLIGNNIFGSSPYNWTEVYSLSSVKTGDIIQYGNTKGSGHTVFVVNVSGDTITFADCNGNGNGTRYNPNTGKYEWIPDLCKVKWDNTTTISSNSLFGYTFSYIKSAPEEVTNVVIPQGSQTISDGDYHIVTMLDKSKGLDLLGANNSNGANIDIYPNTEKSEQVFNVSYLGNGSYKIIHKNSQKSLDCNGAGTTPGTNVQIWDYDGSEQQQWIIQETGDGESFYIISKKSGLCLDIDGGLSADFSNVQIYTPNQTTAQKWMFIAWGREIGQTVSDGEYHIASKLNPAMCLDVYNAGTENNTNIDLYSNITSPEQTFIISYLGDGYYKIINKHSGKSLDIYGGKCTLGTNIQQFDYENVDQQKWIIKPTSDGKSFNIISKKGGLYIDIQDGTANNFNNIQAYISNGTNAQKWNFIAWSDDSQNIIQDGEYQIISQIDNSKAISVSNNSYSDSANIVIENNNICNWQVFSISYIGGGYYTIINKETGKSLDCDGAGCVSGTNVQQYFYDNVNQQKWIIRRTNNQTFSIQSKASGLFLTAENDLNVNVKVGNSELNQQWVIKSLYDVGDTNLDGNIDIRDVTAIQRHLVELEKFNDEQLALADSNGDGEINIADATHLQMYLSEYDIVLGKQS